MRIFTSELARVTELVNVFVVDTLILNKDCRDGQGKQPKERQSWLRKQTEANRFCCTASVATYNNIFPETTSELYNNLRVHLL